MNEDPGGVVGNPGFMSPTPSQPMDFLLTANPVSGFDYMRTNDTIHNAGRNNPQIIPPKVPHTFPTFYPALAPPSGLGATVNSVPRVTRD